MSTMRLSSGLVVVLAGAMLALAAVPAQGFNLRSGSAKRMEVDARVVGGAEVLDRCRAPYNSMVALQMETPLGIVTFCSAVMLTDRLLLTTAFCIEGYNGLAGIKTYAVVGERDLQMADIDEQKISIAAAKMHPGANTTTFDNNIGVMLLATPARMSSCVKPAYRMQEDPNACPDIDSSCLLAGWGPYSYNGLLTNSRLPRYAAVTVYGDMVTSILYQTTYGTRKPEGTLYAEAINSAVKACVFDTGGFVSCQRNGYSVLRGLVGDKNCDTDSNIPIVVTDVPYYQTWLDTCMTDFNTC